MRPGYNVASVNLPKVHQISIHPQHKQGNCEVNGFLHKSLTPTEYRYRWLHRLLTMMWLCSASYRGNQGRGSVDWTARDLVHYGFIVICCIGSPGWEHFGFPLIHKLSIQVIEHIKWRKRSHILFSGLRAYSICESLTLVNFQKGTNSKIIQSYLFFFFFFLRSTWALRCSKFTC